MDNKVDKDIYSTKNYNEKFDNSSVDELSFFDSLNQKIKAKIGSNRQITINNLNEIQNNLNTIRTKANKITESIINHDEHMIVEKQKIIRTALNNIHKNNQDILKFETENLNQQLFTIDNLYNQLIESNLDFYQTYNVFFKSIIDNQEISHECLKNSSEKINYVIEKYFQAIINEFHKLDSKISEIDMYIKQLITTKSHKEKILDEFFDIEINQLIENQINFSINEDPFSDEIKRLTENKDNQYTQYKKFIFDQEDRLEEQLSKEIDDHYQSYYHYKYNKAENQIKAQRYAERKVKSLIKDKKYILFQFKKDNHTHLLSIKKGLDLYKNLYKTDSFLAQIFSDESSKVIAKEVDFTRLYKMNKTLKYHVYYSYKLAQLNHEIRTYEYDFVHHIDNLFKLQEIDTISIIKDIKLSVLEKKQNVDTTQLVLKREKSYIQFLNDLTDKHIKYLINFNNHNRAFLFNFTELLNKNLYNLADMNIEILMSSSSIRLALKESEIETLHFKQMYENEKRLLLIQQSRLKSETDINYDLIASTYLNQMRFAKEQIKLAEEDLKLRLSALVHNVDSERIHFYEMINYEVKLKEKDAFSGFSRYQKEVFDIVSKIEESIDDKQKLGLEKKFDKVKKEYRLEIHEIMTRYINNKNIQLYQKRLEELDMYLEDGYISASRLYDATNKEMDEVYRYAEEKYNQLLENVDTDKFPMDDFLYDSLNDMKKRFSDKMKYVEISLEHKIGNSLDDYRKLYFKEKSGQNSNEIIDLLDSYQAKKLTLEEEYSEEVKQANKDYFYISENFNGKNRYIIEQYELLKQNAIKEKNTSIKHKNSAIKRNDRIFKDFTEKNNLKHQQNLNSIIEGYLLNIHRNRKLHDGLKDDYDLLIKDYSSYIKYSTKTKNIKKIIHQTINNNKKEIKQEIKNIKNEIKNTSLI